MAAPERVTVVAAGVVTPIGADLEAFWSALVTGASGISQIERVAVADLRVQRGGEVKKVGRIKGAPGGARRYRDTARCSSPIVLAVP